MVHDTVGGLCCCFVVGPLLRVLVSVFAPIYWTTVLQSGAARNGYSLTQGQFRQESQLEFETGTFWMRGLWFTLTVPFCKLKEQTADGTTLLL